METDLMPDSALPDRAHLTTEQRLASAAAIDAMTVEQSLRLINTQDMNVAVAVRNAIRHVTPLVEHLVAQLRGGGRLIYLGAGTSGRLGVLDASEMPPTFFSDPDQVVGLIAGGDSALRLSSEGAEDSEDAGAEAVGAIKIGEGDTLVGIAAGGTTPFVWGAIREAKAQGASTALLCCVPIKSLMIRHRAPVVKANQPLDAPPPPRLPAPVDFPVEVLVGPEVVTGSTRLKAGTATKLVLNMISTTVMVQLGKTWGNLMVDLRATNAKLRDRALRIITGQTDLDRDAAAALLDDAGGRVKLALVMARRGVKATEAQLLLEKHDGKLRPILGSPR